ncbi:hypothetical protein HanLR1_Chr16g0604401 [Helianthus annuus]|nr:hypothetical protein HanLR1_Chr16g0604401 [Helianthus annuus]
MFIIGVLPTGIFYVVQSSVLTLPICKYVSSRDQNKVILVLGNL